MSGIVLLVLIGVVVAWLVTGGRKRLRLPTTGRHWIWIIIVVVVVLAIFYGAHTSPHSTVSH
jgi:drug/metabolite transporter (DMT)-like permease